MEDTISHLGGSRKTLQSGELLGGAGARSGCARASADSRTRRRTRSRAPRFRNPRVRACPPGRLSLRPSRDPYINRGQSPEKPSSLLAAAWRSCGAARAARRQRKRERLGVGSSGCCKELGANLAPSERPYSPFGCPFYVLLSPVLDPTSPPSVFRAAIAKTEGERGGRSLARAAASLSPPRAGLAPGTSVRRSWGITTGCATTG